VDGLRVDRLVDGFGPAGDGIVLRNAYISNIRDDCVEGDYLSAGRIEDSLLDGCYAGISVDPVTRPSPKNPEPLVLDGVLMRLKPFTASPTAMRAIRLFKSEAWANIVVRNSVFLVDKTTTRADQFRAVQAENVTVVWLGDGTFPGPVPPGVTVVTDPSVWEEAREDWLREHGYEPVPASPSLFPAPTTTSGQVSLEWTLGPGAESYRVKRAVSQDGPYETIAELGAAARTYDDTTVENGARYYYAVSAVNADGESDNSNQTVAVAVADDAGVPGQVHNLVAVPDPNPHGQHVQGEGRVDLTWNHVAGAESYVVRRGTTPGQYTNEFVTRENSYGDAGLRPQGTTFYYQVVAQNRHGRGVGSSEADATPLRVSRDLGVTRFDPWQLPTELQASGLPAIAGDGQIRLSWLFPKDASGDVSFHVKRSTTQGGPYEEIALVPPDPPNVAASTYTDTGLSNGTTYYYVVQSEDGAGISPESAEVSETPQAAPVLPGAPTDLGTSLVNDKNAVRLRWDAAGLASAYTVERATSPAGPFVPLYRFVRGTTYTDYGLQSNTDYVYRVRAVNSFGDSAPSNAATAKVRSVDHRAPTVTVSKVRDGAVYTLGAEPKPKFAAADSGGLAWKDDMLHRPDTATGAGTYTYVASAADRATNENHAYATYSVRYRFSGITGALSSPGRTFPADEAIPVTFRLSDAKNRGVRDAGFDVLVDGVPAQEWGTGLHHPSGTYEFLLDPRQLSAELHTLTLVLDDGTSRQTTFHLQ
jgi:fibronectin type 3 domain-containing protein